MTKEELEILVRQDIEKHEKLGDQAGGSGHMAHVSYEIRSIDSRTLGKNRIKVFYSYVTYTETEFTYYPDNPPYENYVEREMEVRIEK